MIAIPSPSHTGLDVCSGCGLPLRGHEPAFHAAKVSDGRWRLYKSGVNVYHLSRPTRGVRE